MEKGINIQTERLTKEQRDITIKVIGELLVQPNADFKISLSNENEVLIQKLINKGIRNLIIDEFGGIANSLITTNKSGYTCEYFHYEQITEQIIRDNINILLNNYDN